MPWLFSLQRAKKSWQSRPSSFLAVLMGPERNRKHSSEKRLCVIEWDEMEGISFGWRRTKAVVCLKVSVLHLSCTYVCFCVCVVCFRFTPLFSAPVLRPG
jgi:hypothetical protein